MGVFRSWFGKSSPQKGGAASTSDDLSSEQLLDQIGDESAAAVGLDELSVNSSPNHVCRYIFQQMMGGRSAEALQSDLVGRGFRAMVADQYIQLIRATMFKGR